MALLNIDLQDGFAGDTVVIHVNGQEVFHKANVVTRTQISYADGVSVPVAASEATVQVDLPDRGLSHTQRVPVAEKTHLSVNLNRDGQLLVREEPEGFRYA